MNEHDDDEHEHDYATTDMATIANKRTTTDTYANRNMIWMVKATNHMGPSHKKMSPTKMATQHHHQHGKREPSEYKHTKKSNTTMVNNVSTSAAESYGPNMKGKNRNPR